MVLKIGQSYITCNLKGTAHGKNENLWFLAPAQKEIECNQILVSYEAPFRSNLQKNTGQVGSY